MNTPTIEEAINEFMHTYPYIVEVIRKDLLTTYGGLHIQNAERNKMVDEFVRYKVLKLL